MELPCVGDDVGKVGPLRFPAEFALRFLAGGDTHRRVAGSASLDVYGEVDSGDFADCVEDLLARVPLAVAEIEDVVASRLNELESE